VGANTGDLRITAKTAEKVLRDVQAFVAGSASNCGFYGRVFAGVL
jgi:hypothetical protein